MKPESENIAVCVRIRPLNQREITADETDAWSVDGCTIAPSLSQKNNSHQEARFQFGNLFETVSSEFFRPHNV